MPEGSSYQFRLDKTNLIKAGRIPVIAAAIGGALWLLGFLGGIMGVIFWVVAAFAGYWYASLVLKSGAKPSLIDVAINGAILGAVVSLVYGVVTWIAISIRMGGAAGFFLRWGFGSFLGRIVEGAIGGAIVAAGWFAYKSGLVKTE
jgi:hypothetical protein